MNPAQVTGCSRALAASALCMLLGVSATAHASAPVKLRATDAAANDQFGNAVAVDGDIAVVGAQYGDSAANDAGAAYVYRWAGAGWIEEAILTATDAGAGDYFGASVALDGDTVIVGAYGDDESGSSSGSAYIFVRSGSSWTQQSKLTASDGAATDLFGQAVALSGDTAIVGARNGDGAGGADQGSAYIFVRSGSAWTEQAKLTASDAAASDYFGAAVSISDDTAIVGAYFDDDAGSNSGSAYVYVRNGSSWTQQAKITASDAAASDSFGQSVALSGDSAVVGAPYDDDAGSTSGSAYVYVRSGSSWTEQAKLTASDAAAGDRFGESVSLDGHSALIGADRDDSGGSNAGAAYIYTRVGSVWSEQAKLTAPDAAALDNFGGTVAIDGDMAIVGAYADDDAGTDSGSAHIFERIGSAWIGPDQKITASDAAAVDYFGVSVAIDGDTSVVGAYIDDDTAGSDQGSAYVFLRTGSSWSEQAKLTASDAAASDQFGVSVALSADTAIVGADADDDGGAQSGSAYVYVRSGSSWAEQAKLTATDAAANDYFGHAVAIDGDAAIVGAYSDEDAAGISQGSAYIFTRTGASWSQQAKLTASDAAASDNFGISVALDGDTAIVGAYGDDDAGNFSGSAYVFVRSGATWSEQAKLTASDAAAGDAFGGSVAIDGDTLLVGANSNDDAGNNSGSVYVFSRSGQSWSEDAKLTASDASSGDLFGRCVTLEGDTVVVGAVADDGPAAINQGSAYVFKRRDTFWSEVAKLTAPDAALNDHFGISGALSGDTAIIGAYLDDDTAAEQGSAWLFNIGEEDLPALVRNSTAGTLHDSLSEAINSASPTHFIEATAPAFWDIAPTDYITKALSISGASRVRQPYHNSITLADGASLHAASGWPMSLYGLVRTPNAAFATISSSGLTLGAGGALDVFTGAALTLQSSAIQLDGDTLLLPGSSLVATGPVSVDGAVTLSAATFSGPSLSIGHGGRFVGDGDLFTNVENSDEFITVDSTLISGDLTNNAGATVTVQIGTLTLLGNLTNNGVIVGDLQTLLRGAQTQPGDGFSVGGQYNAGPNASLLMSSDLWRVSVGGDFNVAINDNARYDMAQAELRIGAGLPTSLERMSVNVGPDSDGLDRTIAGHFPIGTLRLTGNVTNLVDIHDNDQLGQGSCEALYVSTLIIDAGATLNTNGCPVYYENLTNNGSVDDINNLIQIASCIADITGDGVVDGADLAALLAQWGGPGSADLTGDGNVDGADLAALLASWGPC